MTVSESKFDGRIEVSLEPGWLWSSKVKLGLFWNSDMDKDELIMRAVYGGAELIADGESLHFNVDGELFHFESFDETTDLDIDSAGTSSSKRYRVTRRFVEGLLEAERVVAKLDLDQTYAEGVLKGGPTTAKSGMKKFLAKIDKYVPAESE